MKLLSLILILIFIYSCGYKQETVSGSQKNPQKFNTVALTKSEIFGEIIEKPEYNSAIVGIVKDNHITCTGTLIEKNIILTAAHCVISSQNYEFIKYHTDYYLEKFSDQNEKVNFINNNFIKLISDFSLDLGIYFGDGIKGSEVYDSQKNVKHIIIDKSYYNYLINNYRNRKSEILDDDYFKANDVALIFLKKDELINPMHLLKNVNSISDQKIIYQTGYGNNGNFYGVKATTKLEISKITNNKISTLSHNTACSGDSGGPSVVKINNQFFIIGIASTGPQSCNNSSDNDLHENILTIFSEEDFLYIKNTGLLI